jgi:hypothetical protein
MEYVVPRLSDGLGNRLFQYAVALGLAQKWGRKIAFSRSFIVSTNHGDLEDFIKLFPHVPIIDGPENPKILMQASEDLFKYVEFKNAPLENVVLIDYRQNPQYFIGVDLKPAWPPAEGNAAWMIHFRRGDYDKLSHYSVDLTRYYRRCILAVPEGSTLRIFSDEPSKCNDMLDSILDGRQLNISWCTETIDYKAMYEMSLCTGGAITANSTFSWWGAYFARGRAGSKFQAFYPSCWGAGLPDPAGIVPTWGEIVDIK